MDKQLASVAMQFLQRLNLTGAEVPAFMAVSNAIGGIADGSLVVTARPVAAQSFVTSQDVHSHEE